MMSAAWPELLGATAPERLALVLSGIMIVILVMALRAVWNRLKDREQELAQLYGLQREFLKELAGSLRRDR